MRSSATLSRKASSICRLSVRPSRDQESAVNNDPSQEARFCCCCGGPLEQRWLDAEQRHRLACARCGYVHYRNPHVLVAAMITHGDRILMCRRAHEPNLD